MSDINKLFEPTLENSVGLPAEAYLSDDVFKAETKQLFHQSWLCIGLSNDVPENGDIKPVNFAGIPLLIVRDHKSELRVFHNVCPHRGAQLTDKSQNCRGNIVCPYHAWAFELNGATARLPHVGGASIHNYEGIDGSIIGLSQVRHAEWYGLLFINISGTAVDFKTFIKPVQDRIGDLDADSLRYDKDLSTTMDFNANWKLVVENFVESYHVPKVHPELEQVNPMRNHYQILGGFSYIGQGGMALTTEEEEDLAGLPHRNDQESPTCYEAFYIYPNLIFSPIYNFTFVIIADPQSTTITHERLEFGFYGDNALSEKFDEQRKANADFLKLVNNQDITICEKAQIGRTSPAFQGGLFALPQEATTLHFLKLVAANMLGTEDKPAEDLISLPVENIYHPISD